MTKDTKDVEVLQALRYQTAIFEQISRKRAKMASNSADFPTSATSATSERVTNAANITKLILSSLRASRTLTCFLTEALSSVPSFGLRGGYSVAVPGWVYVADKFSSHRKSEFTFCSSSHLQILKI